MRFASRPLAVFFAGAVLAAPCVARANGRYPQAGQIAVDPDDATHLVVRNTYGLAITRDGGKKWGWVCEPAVGYNGAEDPMMGIPHGGDILAAIFEGLSISSDGGCNWTSFKPLKGKYVIDLAVDKVTPSNAILIVTNNAGTNTFITQLWQSSDAGATWTQAGVNMPSDFVGLTVDSAPSDPNTVYASGRVSTKKFPGALQKSTDRGKTWKQVIVPGTDEAHAPYIGALDPNDPNVVYVRIKADEGDSVIVTKDAGVTWTTLHQSKDPLYGFARK